MVQLRCTPQQNTDILRFSGAVHGGSLEQALDSRTPWGAAKMGHRDVVQWLAQNGGSVVQANPLYIAAQNGRLVVQWLAENGGDVNQDINGFTPLFIMVYHRHLGVVQWLAENGASVDQPVIDGRTPLYIAARWTP